MDAVRLVLRGYPLTAALALTLVFLAVMGIARKGRALAKRWSDTHIPAVVRPGTYDQVVADLERALDDADLTVTPRDAPAVLAVPGRLLASVAGRHFQTLVPERLKQLTGPGIEVLIHQSDIAISGGKARGRPRPCRDRQPPHLDGRVPHDLGRSPGRSSGVSRRSPTTPRTRWPSSPGSTRSSQPSRSTPTSGRSSTGSASRSSATCSPAGRSALPPGRPAIAARGRCRRSGPVTELAAGFGIAAMVGVLLAPRHRGHGPRTAPRPYLTGFRAQRGYHPPVPGDNRIEPRP